MRSRRTLLNTALLASAALSASPARAVFVDKEIQNGETVPTGTYHDMTANLPIVGPTRVACPVLLVKGEYDGISTTEDPQAFFAKLPNGDRQFSITRSRPS